MVSIVSRKDKATRVKVEDFSVDYLLPVQLGNECAMALMDRYDISNKAILCDPSFDVDSIQWFQNSYNRLRIVPDEEVESMPDVHFTDIDAVDTELVDTYSVGTRSTRSSEASSEALSAYSTQTPSMTQTLSCRSWSPSTMSSVPATVPAM